MLYKFETDQNINKIVEVFDDSGNRESPKMYIVLEHVEGQTFGSLIRNQEADMEKLTRDSEAYKVKLHEWNRLVYDILLQVLEVLGRIHAQGCVHQDIKPDNIMVNVGTRTVKLIDFVTCRYIRDISDFRGTPLYCPPETFYDSREVDGKLDIFAWGVMAFYALKFHYPWTSKAHYTLSIEVINFGKRNNLKDESRNKELQELRNEAKECRWISPIMHHAFAPKKSRFDASKLIYALSGL